MSKTLSSLILFIVLFINIFCNYVNNSGVDTDNVVTDKEFASKFLSAYTIKYLSCGYNPEDVITDPLTLVKMRLQAPSGSASGGDTIQYLKDFKFLFEEPYVQFFLKHDMNYCSNTILSVPCESTLETQRNALYMASFQACNPERVNFRDKGQGNY